MHKGIRILLLFAAFFLALRINNAWAEEILSWEDCLKEAAKNNPALISAVENVNQLKASKAIAASTLFPQINSSLSGSTAKTTTSGKSSTADSYSYGVTGSQLLFDGFKTINNVKVASENINAAKENYRYTSSEVRLRLRNAFISLLRAQELIRVAEDIFKIRRDNLELITLRYESGLEHRGALLTAEANLAQAGFTIAQAKRDTGLAQRQLTKEMGRTEFKPMQVKGDFNVSDSAREKPDLEALAKSYPQFQQAIAKKNAAAFSVSSAYANFSPQLSGQAGANKAGTRWLPKNDEWNLGLTLSWPVFEGGLRIAQVQQARAALNQADADMRSSRDGAITALEQMWVALQDALETVGIQHKTLEAAKERAEIAEAQYSTGFISYDNWSIIQDNLVQAKRNYLEAQANALFAEANWVQAKGETLEYAQK